MKAEALRWAGRGLTAVRHALALMGVLFVLAVVTLFVRPDLLKAAEDSLYRALAGTAPAAAGHNTAERATAADLAALTKRQALVSDWLARKYRVAPEPMAALVLEAYGLSQQTKLSPHLILAVAAIESNFHPYIQSEAGAQGLMQVMPRVHRKRYEEHGGSLAAFDPVVNMRVGVGILQDFIRLRGGSVEEGLKAYLGGVALEEDGGYVGKVRAEEARLDRVAAGEMLPLP